jgi:hypothetical protein
MYADLSITEPTLSEQAEFIQEVEHELKCPYCDNTNKFLFINGRTFMCLNLKCLHFFVYITRSIYIGLYLYGDSTIFILGDDNKFYELVDWSSNIPTLKELEKHINEEMK